MEVVSYFQKDTAVLLTVSYICDPICKNPEQSRILENSDFCTMVFCIPEAFFCSSIKSVIQIGLELQG